MTRELIIEGQQVDLAPNTDITLEYVSNFIGDVEKIKFSHSYTVKLPRTIRNARILDDPGNPGHNSTMARRYFSAQYYRNGINLIGQARAYLLDVTDDSYEIALIWSSIPGLSEWNSAKPKLPDLQGLPVLAWKNAPLADRDTTEGCFYAEYTSGARPNTSETAPHPCVTMYELITRIFNNAGIPYIIGPSLESTLKNHALLVAPSHKPSFEMELAAGAQSYSLNYKYFTTASSFLWWFQDWQTGWDAPGDGSLENSTSISRGPTNELRFFLNLKIENDVPDIYLQLSGSVNTSPYILQPSRTEDGGYLLDEVVDLSNVLELDDAVDSFGIRIQGLEPNGDYQFSPYDPTRPLFAIMRPHEAIPADHQNLFPVAENLPGIGQMEFINGTLGLFGGVIMDGHDKLILKHYNEILEGRDTAVDWSEKIEMSAGITQYSNTLQDFAQQNIVKYESDVTLPVSPDFAIVMQDEIASLSQDYIKLPFAASRGSEALHYKRTAPGEYEDIDIKPRVFGFEYTDEGNRKLIFSEDMMGTGAVNKYYRHFQALIARPVLIQVNARLHELDLAGIDLTRPIYLRQYGQYYMILKIQTSKTDLCKVELIQIP